jgi:hypothetical protein
MEIIKMLGVLVAAIATALLSHFRNQAKELTKQVETQNETINDLEETAKINRKVARTDINTLNTELLAKQRNRS